MDVPKSNSSLEFEKMNVALVEFCDGINGMGFSHGDTNSIYKMIINLVNQLKQLNANLLADNNVLSPTQVLNMSTDFISNKLKGNLTKYKREKTYEEMK